MNRQNKTITELTPEQMGRVSGGGTGSYDKVYCMRCRTYVPAVDYHSHIRSCSGFPDDPTQEHVMPVPNPKPDPVPVQNK